MSRHLKLTKALIARDWRLLVGLTASQAVVWTYFWATQSRRGAEATWLAVTAAVYIFQAVQLGKRARQAPLWRTAALLLATLSIIVGTFATAYYGLRGYAFNEPLTHIDALYVAVGTLSTAGSGSVSAASQTARGFQTVEMIVGMVTVLFAVGAFVSRFASDTSSDSH